MLFFHPSCAGEAGPANFLLQQVTQRGHRSEPVQFTKRSEARLTLLYMFLHVRLLEQSSLTSSCDPRCHGRQDVAQAGGTRKRQGDATYSGAGMRLEKSTSIQKTRTMRREHLQWGQSLLQVRPQDSILQLDAGTGAVIERSMVGVPQGMDAAPGKPGRNGSAFGPSVALMDHNGLMKSWNDTLTWPDAAFDKILFCCVPMQDAESLQILKSLRRVLKPEGQIAVLGQPDASPRGDLPFRPPYDDLAQAYGSEIAAHLRASGFGTVRLRFKPAEPVAVVAALGTVEGATDSLCLSSFFFEFQW